MYKAFREGFSLKKLIEKIKNRKATASVLALAVLTALIFWATNSPAVVGVSAGARQLPIYCVQRDDKTVALSFDAAWGNEDTQQLIDILKKYNVNATFFVVGQWAEKYPESVKALHEAGNEVMSHSDDHAHFSKLSADEIKSNITASNKKIQAATGTAPTLFRCPYGEYNDTVISTVNAMGMTAIQWDVDSLDWKGIGAKEISERVLKSVKPGSIVLFHNAAENTPEALPTIIEALLADGYSIVPVSQILLSGDYMIDNTGMQCRANNDRTT